MKWLPAGNKGWEVSERISQVHELSQAWAQSSFVPFKSEMNQSSSIEGLGEDGQCMQLSFIRCLYRRCFREFEFIG